MFGRLKILFDTELPSSGELNQEERNLACAALLIEVAVIDQEFDPTEFAALKRILAEQYDVANEECDALAQTALQESENATSMYQFTQKVNQHCSTEEKFDLVKGMWTIAFADGDLDKYEEYIIRKTCGLLYVSHSDFIRAKQEARPQNS